MERRASYVPRESVDGSRADGWAREICDYLLGRLSKQRRIELLPWPHAIELAHVPVRRWWTFEGKQYVTLGGPLAENWNWIVNSVRRLRGMFDPRLRLSDRPDGVVDWGQTLARGPQQFHQDYVVRSSAIGLNEEEDAALRGWVRWIDEEWTEYTCSAGMELKIPWRDFATDSQGHFTVEQLRRWAHIARRSRWPLLHGVVAETLRPVLEPDELDRIPLPAEEATLFELLCLVRIARFLSPAPQEIRWLGDYNAANTIDLEGTRIYYQQPLAEERVLATYEQDGALAAAAKRFALRTPKRVDLAIDFNQKMGGFDGLIVESKSGSQEYTDALAQLRTYRAARQRKPGARYLIWGIVEAPAREATVQDVRDMLLEAQETDDVWVFSSADAIPVVMDSALGTRSSFR